MALRNAGYGYLATTTCCNPDSLDTKTCDLSEDGPSKVEMSMLEK